MSILEGLRLAVNGLLSNRLRSVLTMLGILIGVSAVILLVGVGNGASVAVQQQIQSLGSNLLTVFPSNARGAGGVQQGCGRQLQSHAAARQRGLQRAWIDLAHTGRGPGREGPGKREGSLVVRLEQRGSLIRRQALDAQGTRQ